MQYMLARDPVQGGIAPKLCTSMPMSHLRNTVLYLCNNRANNPPRAQPMALCYLRAGEAQGTVACSANPRMVRECLIVLLSVHVTLTCGSYGLNQALAL